ncbi:hypothetical protein GRI89_03245 [Altererythrobacter salegens]|uniref:Lipoprotein n=1 Tax=Croceibacterium salegens TaxID=1737568 RepID=A0A6I4SU14_9SPHN|nr:hypothetical protein [Croceibacterium salegens]MXO58557.1 hypothetical protein [Croceibacterium salegens]
MGKYIGALLTFAGLILGGCAHTPDVTVGYYLPKSDVSFKVIRTVACDKDSNPIVATAVTPTVKHTADMSSRKTVALSGLRGALSDTDVKFEFFEDGRLSGLNANSTGQGEAILKTVMTIASTVLGTDAGTGKYPKECGEINSVGGGKPLTLTYEGSVDLTKSSTDAQVLGPDPTSAYYATKFHEIVGNVCAFVTGSESPQAPAEFQSRSGNVLLDLRQPGTVSIKLSAGPADDCKGNEIWNSQVTVAQFGTPYQLPIPAAAVFGKQQFAISIAESGALKSVQYVSNTGAGQVLNLGNETLAALQGDTTVQKLAEVRAEADLIAQQQRLVGCLADPTTCK